MKRSGIHKTAVNIHLEVGNRFKTQRSAATAMIPNIRRISELQVGTTDADGWLNHSFFLASTKLTAAIGHIPHCLNRIQIRQKNFTNQQLKGINIGRVIELDI